jgi:methyl-accepting chemotaxis protein
VVAAEVRSLAQRSSAAAHEIKDLIDASVSTANVGGALVDRARDSMAQITHAIKEVVTHIDDIALTSNEQRLGIESLNRSVDEIEKMTQQNAALVEQSAAASMRVRDQAEQLSAAVNGFKTPV